MENKPDYRTFIAKLRKDKDPVAILKFIRDNGCNVHYPLESVLILPQEQFTFLDLINECLEDENGKEDS